MRLNQRDLLGGDAAERYHIASMVVQCRPEKLASTVIAIASIEHVEVPEQDACGKLVALIQTQGESNLMSCIREIETAAGVISASLAYHQIDE
ncbi:MAG: chaperone NapD [Gammaproteobacteria bacterium]|nr:chaperone NapD [Gammaproteobacteria bacterium]